MVILSALPAIAQEDVFFWGQTFGVGARAIGMGGAYSSIADDYSGIYWNPAGLGQVSHSEFYAGMNRNMTNTQTTFLNNQDEITDGFTHLNALGLVLPFPTVQGSFVVGFGFHQPRMFDNRVRLQGYNKSWAAFPDFFDMVAPDDQYTDVLDNVYQIEDVTENGGLNHYALSASVEFQKNLYIGSTFSIIQGNNDYSLQLKEEDTRDLHNSRFQDDQGNLIVDDLDYWVYNQSITSKFKGIQFKMGMLYRLSQHARIGATVTAPTTMNIDESWSDEWQEVYDDGTTYTTPPEPYGSEYKIQEPFAFSMGGSINLPFIADTKLLVSADIEYKDWSEAQFKTNPPLKEKTKNEMNNIIQNNFRAVTPLHLGGELFVPFIQSKIRAGYQYKPSPYQEADVQPDKQCYSGGLSVLLDNQIKIDVAFMRAMWEQEVFDVFTNTTTLEDKMIDMFMATLSVRF